MAGRARLALRRPEAAVAPLEQADRLAPDRAEILTDLATALRDSGRFAEALALFRRITRQWPDPPAGWSNLCNALRDAGDLAASEAAGARALRLDPGHAQAHYNLAITLLAAGRHAEAWPHYEWRWQALHPVAPAPGPATWTGAATDRPVLLHAEQGAGDTIQFCRYVPLAAARVPVVLGVPPTLARLLAPLPGVRRIVTDAAAWSGPHCPLPSLPHALGADAAAPPAPPYLHAEPAALAGWRARLAGLPGRKVGLAWAGNPGFAHDRLRSIPDPLLGALGGIDGIALVSVQKPRRAAPGLDLLDWTDELADFADTAALIAALDLVIGVDTAVVHLAGALGRPVWLLNRFAPDWRWGLTGAGSHWYPTLRQFRQSEPGGWAAVLARVRAELFRLAAQN